MGDHTAERSVKEHLRNRSRRFCCLLSMLVFLLLQLPLEAAASDALEIEALMADMSLHEKVCQ